MTTFCARGSKFGLSVLALAISQIAYGEESSPRPDAKEVKAENAAATAQATELPAVIVVADRLADRPFSASTTGADLARRRAATNDSARLLEGAPGMSFQSGGGVSSLPVVDGMADDRVRILVDGMSITSACPNHMNPALSYIDPAAVAKVEVMAGITPVSLGGDSIGGAITIQSADPVFAAPGKGTKTEGSASAYYRSNGYVSGGSLHASAAGESLYFAYTGATVKSADYKDGNGQIQRSSEYESRNNLITLATRSGAHLLSLQGGWQDIPRQGFPNQIMDMTSNRSRSLNLLYKGDFDWGQLEARAFSQYVRHKMDMLTDKANIGVMAWGVPTTMPMDTEARDAGYSVQGTLALSTRDTVRLGHEYHGYWLNDWWPPVAGSMMMGPNPFWNINGGKRNRLALFGEWDAKWSQAWSSQLGLRFERVSMNTGLVQGYYSTGDAAAYMVAGLPNGFIYQNDANAFNARDHKRVDNNLDLTAAFRYEPSESSTFDFGVARKTRSPSLYERFVWSNESGMAGAMNTWFGDINAYVGNLDLRPEVANTLRASADWHDAEHSDWEFKVMPFYTRVHDYINVETNLAAITNWLTPGRATLRFVNHGAELYGLDLSGKKFLGRAGGEWTGRAALNYVHGRDLTSGTNLYNIMPLNLRLSLDHHLGSWLSSIELEAVGAKSKVDALRMELPTAGYALVNLRTSYNWNKVRLDAGINNLFNRQYDLPLGGLDAYRASYDMNILFIPPIFHAVRGMGRSINLGVTVGF